MAGFYKHCTFWQSTARINGFRSYRWQVYLFFWNLLKARKLAAADVMAEGVKKVSYSLRYENNHWFVVASGYSHELKGKWHE